MENIDIFTMIDKNVFYLQNKSGIPADQIKLILLHGLMVPFGFYFQTIKSEMNRKIISSFLGIFMSIILYGYIALTIIPLVIFMYYLTYWTSKHRELTIFISSFLLLACFQLYNMIYYYGMFIMNISSTIMLIIPKFTYYACEFREKKPEGLFNYFSYCFFYATCLIGPVFEYKIFKEYIQKEGVYKNINGSLKATLKSILNSVITLGVLISTPTIFSPKALQTEEYFNSNFFYQSFIFFGVISFLQFRYYAGFSIHQSTTDSCGISFDGKGFDRVRSIKILTFIFEKNARNKISMWNSSIHKWLKFCIFNRISNKEYAGFITFLFSGIWHGLYPTYVICFVQWYLILEFNKYGYSCFEMFEWIPKFIRNPIIWATNIFLFHYLGSLWIHLNIEHLKKYFFSLNGIPTILIIVIYLTMRMLYQAKRGKRNIIPMIEKKVKSQ